LFRACKGHWLGGSFAVGMMMEYASWLIFGRVLWFLVESIGEQVVGLMEQ